MFCRDLAELSGWDSPHQKAVREHVGRRHTHVCLWRRTPNTAESGDASVPAPQLRGRAIYGLYGAWLTRAGHSQERDLENKRVSQRRVCTHETACDYVRASLHGCERSHVLRDAARTLTHTERHSRCVVCCHARGERALTDGSPEPGTAHRARSLRHVWERDGGRVRSSGHRSAAWLPHQHHTCRLLSRWRGRAVTPPRPEAS